MAKAKTLCNSKINLEGKYIELRVEDLKLQKKEEDEAIKELKRILEKVHEEATRKAEEKTDREEKDKSKEKRKFMKKKEQQNRENEEYFRKVKLQKIMKMSMA